VTALAACGLAAVWSANLTGLGSSIWTITADGAAVEQGLGNARGTASIVGRRLTINWASGPDAAGDYIIDLNNDCISGRGVTRWLRMPPGVELRQFPTTFERRPNNMVDVVPVPTMPPIVPPN
jgi:hypothetical protein